jgi:hypothetical protein
MNPSDDIIGLLNVIAALLLIIIGLMFYATYLFDARDRLLRNLEATLNLRHGSLEKPKDFEEAGASAAARTCSTH